MYTMGSINQDKHLLLLFFFLRGLITFRIWNTLKCCNFWTIQAKYIIVYIFLKGNESKNPFLASNFTLKNLIFWEKLQKNYFSEFGKKHLKALTWGLPFLFLIKNDILGFCYQKVPQKKEVSLCKLVSLDDFWQISEFLTKNCFC